MNRAERKRHEDAGWQVGSAADFLGLTPQESAYIELRIRLADALKARRQMAKLSQEAFATAMKSSQSRIAKAEANSHTVSVDLLIRSLIGLGVSLEELGSILAAGQSNVLSRSAPRQKLTRKAKQARKNKRKNRVKPAKTSASAA